MHTGDGIERVSGADASQRSNGGEGGSVLQALGSKDERKYARKKRRRDRKKEYERYLLSETWKKIRAAALERDEHACRACGKKATAVHHIRYPMNLGEEKMEWLYSLCTYCHTKIHAIEGATLRAATNAVLAQVEGSVVYIEDDWRLGKAATRKRQTRGLTRGVQQQPKKKRKRGKHGKEVQPAHVSAGRKKADVLAAANDELHAKQKRARENREYRKDSIANWRAFYEKELQT